VTIVQKNAPMGAGDVDASRAVTVGDISATRRMGNASVRQDSWARNATQSAQEDISARTARYPASANIARTVLVTQDDASVDQDGEARAAKSALVTLLADKMKNNASSFDPLTNLTRPKVHQPYYSNLPLNSQPNKLEDL